MAKTSSSLCIVTVAGFGLAREVLRYAVEELEKAVKLGDILLYRNAADKVFLALVIAVNAYIAAVEGVEPTSHAERRKILKKMGREDLRALYSDLMKTLHEEAFYQGVYQPDEVQYAVKKVEEVIAQLEEEVRRRRGPPAPQ
jgi:secreted Zn-dependent insulinase-like peptidase